MLRLRLYRATEIRLGNLKKSSVTLGIVCSTANILCKSY